MLLFRNGTKIFYVDQSAEISDGDLVIAKHNGNYTCCPAESDSKDIVGRIEYIAEEVE